MIEENKEFKDFLKTFYDANSNNYNDETSQKKLKTELTNLLNKKDNKKNLILNPKAKSFFTFDNQREEDLYNPVGQDFNKHYDFVFSGCSQTEGYDITKIRSEYGSNDYIWGFQVANKYNKKSLNLGSGGFSAESIVKGLLYHFAKNGNPKVVLVLYPNFGRMQFVDTDKIIPSSKNEKLIHDLSLSLDNIFYYDKISKAPHKPNDVLTWTQAFYRSIQSIILLEQYCKQQDIYLKYTSWDSGTNIILKILKNILPEYSNYCEIDKQTEDIFSTLFGNSSGEPKQCHVDYSKKVDSSIWNHGADGLHMGVHQHVHIAELFSNAIDQDNPWN